MTPELKALNLNTRFPCVSIKPKYGIPGWSVLLMNLDCTLSRGFLARLHDIPTFPCQEQELHDIHYHSYSRTRQVHLILPHMIHENQHCAQCSCTLGGNSSYFKNPHRHMHMQMREQHAAETDHVPHCLNSKQAADLASSDPS